MYILAPYRCWSYLPLFINHPVVICLSGVPPFTTFCCVGSTFLLTVPQKIAILVIFDCIPDKCLLDQACTSKAVS